MTLAIVTNKAGEDKVSDRYLKEREGARKSAMEESTLAHTIPRNLKEHRNRHAKVRGSSLG